VNPREEWVTKEVPELRIIDQPLWDAVKARQTANAVEGDGIGMWDRRRPRHLLSGLMVCGECGGGYSKVAPSRFGCSSARNKGESVCRNKRGGSVCLNRLGRTLSGSPAAVTRQPELAAAQ
jgi:site-specific DNA recombinase